VTQADIQGGMVAGAIYQKLLEQFPEFAPLFQAVPELQPLFIKSITEGWTTVKFAEELHKTDWWKKTPESARIWLALTASDPAQAQRQREQTVIQYAGIASREGVQVTLPQLAALAEQGLSQGWGTEEVTDNIIGLAKRKDPATGEIDSTVSQLKATAGDWGVPVSDANAFDWAKKIRMGRSSQDAFEETMRQQAKSMFPALADAIDRGVSVRQYADPYAQLAAQTLEINPADFDLTDPKWQSALQVPVVKAGEKMSHFRPQTLAEWRQTMMTDPKYGWDRTDNAKGAALDIGNSIAQQFGFTP
jgi:hypothetical protein